MDLQGTSAAVTVASMAGAGGATAAAAAADAAGGMTAVHVTGGAATVGTCLRCQAGGGDVQVVGRGCCLHAVRFGKRKNGFCCVCLLRP